MNLLNQISDLIVRHQSLLTSAFVISTVTILLALLLAIFLRNKAAWSHGILIASLVLFLATPVLCILVPQSINIDLPSKNLARTATTSSLSQLKIAKNVEATNEKVGNSPKHAFVAAQPQPESGSFDGENYALESKSNSTSQPVSWLAIVVAIWALVSTALLIRLLFLTYWLNRTSKSLVRCVDPKLMAAFQLAKQQVAGCKDVELVQGDLDGPVALNWPKPSVAIPESLVDSLSLDSLRRIFIHELAHIARRDQFVLIFQRVLACLWWPFLPIHLLNRAICRTREDLCDNYIPSHEVVEFCNDLLTLSINASTSTNRLLVAPGLLFSKRNLEHRVGSILSSRRCRASQVSVSQLGLPGFVAFVCTTILASVGFKSNVEQHRYFPVKDDRQQVEFQPLLQSYLLSKRVPDSVTVEFDDNPNDFRFVELRYGTSASDRVTALVVCQSDSNKFRLFLDANRDRIITKDELVRTDDPNSNIRVCSLDSWIQESDECEISKRLARKVIFKRNLLKDRISFATIGYLEGKVTIGDQAVLMRRVDANGNGLFLDDEDRVWIDVNNDGSFGVEEQYSLSPIMIINQQRYRVLANSQKSTIQLEPVTSTGSVRLSLPLKDNRAAIKQLRVTFLGEDGSAFTVDGLQPVIVPTGTCQISNVAIIVADPTNETAKSFVFTRRGQPVGMARSFEIKQDTELDVDPVGELQLVSRAHVKSEEPGNVRVALQLYTSDGLTVSHNDIGVRGDSIHGSQSNQVKTSVTGQKSEKVSGCMSGFY